MNCPFFDYPLLAAHVLQLVTANTIVRSTPYMSTTYVLSCEVDCFVTDTLTI